MVGWSLFVVPTPLQNGDKFHLHSHLFLLFSSIILDWYLTILHLILQVKCLHVESTNIIMKEWKEKDREKGETVGKWEEKRGCLLADGIYADDFRVVTSKPHVL